MNQRIVIDPEICHGKPIIRGTRTPVTVILDALAGGDTFEMIQSDYDITEENGRTTRMAISPETPDPADELRPEYDFQIMRGVVRGKYATRYRERLRLVRLAADVAAAFPTKRR